MAKEIICKDCGRTFVFTDEEAEYFEYKGYPDPVRCKECRTIRKRNYRAYIKHCKEEINALKTEEGK